MGRSVKWGNSQFLHRDFWFLHNPIFLESVPNRSASARKRREELRQESHICLFGVKVYLEALLIFCTIASLVSSKAFVSLKIKTKSLIDSNRFSKRFVRALLSILSMLLLHHLARALLRSLSSGMSDWSWMASTDSRSLISSSPNIPPCFFRAPRLSIEDSRDTT